ncbi:MAG: hypothetical protein GF416_08715 [Candidatus Altiarchaeales archaeon]|nr:hypothetical protein [Candidatus Altiarchaeales archaeon]MBD3417198.1 hypothetical protein [Candidatus Altiarchaeales archaeon]
MVSGKFHVKGDDRDWIRIRLQEEIISHGLEGNVLKASENNIVVVVEGDKSRIKRLYTDVTEFMPDEVEVVDLTIRPSKKPRRIRMRGVSPGRAPERIDYIQQYLQEIEKTTQRLDQKMNTILAILEGVGGSEILQRSSLEDREGFEDGEMDVEEDATGGFAAMFGD